MLKKDQLIIFIPNLPLSNKFSREIDLPYETEIKWCMRNLDYVGIIQYTLQFKYIFLMILFNFNGNNYIFF